MENNMQFRRCIKKYRVSIKSFPDYIYYKKTTYVEYIFFFKM